MSSEETLSTNTLLRTPCHVHRYVLQDFSKKEKELVDVAVRESVDIVKSVLALGLERALSGVRA